jgi:hypothetical protein
MLGFFGDDGGVGYFLFAADIFAILSMFLCICSMRS